VDFENQLQTEHLLMEDRVCRTCGIEKGLLADFYRCRKDPSLRSSYSYECKQCAIQRVKSRVKQKYRLGTCEICGSSNTKLRKDVCISCNKVLNLTGSNVDTLKQFVLYLER